MDANHSQIREALGDPAEAREVGTSTPPGLSTALPPEVWDELAEEASQYLKLWTAWKNVPQQDRSESQARLENDLIQSLLHLQAHTQAMNETIEDHFDLLDQLEEHDLIQSS